MLTAEEQLEAFRLQARLSQMIGYLEGQGAAKDAEIERLQGELAAANKDLAKATKAKPEQPAASGARTSILTDPPEGT